jgi:hypothetical protein
VALLEEPAWQRGKRWRSELANRRALTFMILSAPIFAAAGGAVALTVSWPLRAVLSALIGLGVAVLIVLVIPGLYALFYASFKQRDEAREYAAALETHVQEYGTWARRSQIADDFKHETLEDARRIGAGNLVGSVSDEETRWRTIVSQIGEQMQANGGDISVFVDAQIAALNNTNDGLGDDESARLARIRNSMLATGQNLWSETRREAPPSVPGPPRTDSSDQ